MIAENSKVYAVVAKISDFEVWVGQDRWTFVIVKYYLIDAEV